MKKTLLLIAAALMTTVATFAQTWTAPEEPTTGSDLVSGMRYKIKNVESGNCLAGGTSWYSWATSTVLSEQSAALTFTLTYVEDTIPTKTGWTIARTSDGKFTFVSGDSPAGLTNLGEMHVDMASQGHNYFDIVKQENGYYHIRTIAADATYGESSTIEGYYGADKCWGWEKSEEAQYPTAVYGNVTPGDQYACDWEFINMSTYDARLNLYNTLVEAVDVEGCDYSAASAVYNNPDATLEELESAYETLKNNVKTAKANAVLNGATEDDPKDGTSLIENADFSAGNIDGWDCTFVSGTTATNVGYQSANYTNGDVTINQFIEAWAATNTTFNPNQTFRAIGDAELQQTIPGLPQGKYILACDAIANQQDGAVSTVTGVELFATGGGIDLYQSISTGNGLPEHYTLTFINGAQGDVTLGLRTRNCTANWIAADNFTLWYYGPVTKDPQQVVLEDYIKAEEETYPDMDEVRADATIKEEYISALDAARAVANATGKTSEEYTEAKTTFAAVVAKLDASVAEYKSLKSKLDDIQTKMSMMEETWPDLSSELADYYDELNGKYESGTATSEDVAEIDGKVSSMIAEYISQNCHAGDDITVLLTNASFDKDFSGWDYTGTSPVWGGVTTQGHNTLGTMADMDTEAYNTWGGCAERYQAIFDMSQTIKNMPKGLYTFKCQGFDRDDNGGNPAELYATIYKDSVQTNEYTAALTDQKAGATEEQLYNSDGAWYSDVAYGDLWVPNGMAGAMYHFHHKTGESEDYDYTSSLDIILTETSDIKVGVRIDNAGHWVIFDDFKIIYQGSGANVYADPIAKLEAQADALVEAGVSQEVSDKVNAAKSAADEALDNNDEEGCIAGIEALNEAIAACNTSNALIVKVKENHTTYNEYLLTTVESNDEAFPAYLETVATKIEEGFTTDAEIQEYIDGMKSGFTKYVQYDHMDATEAEPADITAAIYNAGYVDPVLAEASANGWEGTTPAVNADATNAEFYNKNFNMYQTIKGLAAGYYVVGLQGYYRRGNWDPEVSDTIQNEVTIYANDAQTNMIHASATLIPNDQNDVTGVGFTVTKDEVTYWAPNTMAAGASYFALEEGNVTTNKLLVYLPEEGDMTIGLKKDSTITGDWCLFDEWTLSYLGTNKPSVDPTTAIQAVEVAENNNVATRRIYNLNGQLVGRAQKGIYIINGKKVVVK